MTPKEQTQKGFTQDEAATHPEIKVQEQEALILLKELLCALNAKDYRERTNQLFFDFLTTEAADYKPAREQMISFHFELVNFFTKLHKLPLIDRCRNPY